MDISFDVWFCFPKCYPDHWIHMSSVTCVKAEFPQFIGQNGGEKKNRKRISLNLCNNSVWIELYCFAIVMFKRMVVWLVQFEKIFEEFPLLCFWGVSSSCCMLPATNNSCEYFNKVRFIEEGTISYLYLFACMQVYFFINFILFCTNLLSLE